ncbi:MAG: hypothetical protein CVT79_09660 [Alphaproteobacteria bacterium HGW-Alphaproteobacteria-18]|nr:MAG: hypothetical protein CVT79_09660 [Alphaproteobacteria bacterium HGW-Alphaproteobacteria-18]
MGTDGSPVSTPPGDAWVFAAADAAGRISEVREKKRISPHATVGLYWFSSFNRFSDAYTLHYSDPGNLEKGERYVAPIYNTLITSGSAVFVHEVPASAVIALAPPADVEAFLRSAPPAL